jgi:hypothetical protein
MRLLAAVVTAYVVPSSLILSTLMMGAMRSSKTSFLARATWHHVPKDDILHRYRRENLESYIALTGCALYRRRNVFPVRYELRFCIPEDDILHSHSREHLRSYIALTGWAL